MLCHQHGEKSRGIYLPFCRKLLILQDEIEEICNKKLSPNFFPLGSAVCHLQNHFFPFKCHMIRENSIEKKSLMINARQWQKLFRVQEEMVVLK